MPRVIKKHPTKTKHVSTQDQEINAIVDKAKGFASFDNKIFLGILGAIAIVLAYFAYSYSNKSNLDKAQRLFFDGYAQYYGLTQKGELGSNDPSRFDRAIDKFKQSIDAKETPIALYYLANAYYSQDKFDDALKTFQLLNSKHPDDYYIPLTYYKMALTALKKDSKEEALKYLDALYNYKTNAFKDVALIESGKILESMGKPDEAKKKYELLVKNHPASTFAQEASQRLTPEPAMPKLNPSKPTPVKK